MTEQCYVCENPAKKTKPSVILDGKHTCNRCEILLHGVRDRAIKETAEIINRREKQ